MWILCLEFFRFFPISVFHWFFTDARSKSHSFSLSAGREKNEFSCIYIWFFCYAHRLSPSIHHLKALVCGMENRLTTIQSMIIIIPNLSSGSQRIFLSVFFFFWFGSLSICMLHCVECCSKVVECRMLGHCVRKFFSSLGQREKYLTIHIFMTGQTCCSYNQCAFFSLSNTTFFRLCKLKRNFYYFSSSVVLLF